jgi:hypothetical protein
LGGHSRVDGDPRKGLGGETGQLVLEAPDLTPQLDPRQPLVADKGWRDRLSCEQVQGHRSRV